MYSLPLDNLSRNISLPPTMYVEHTQILYIHPTPKMPQPIGSPATIGYFLDANPASTAQDYLVIMIGFLSIATSL